MLGFNLRSNNINSCLVADRNLCLNIFFFELSYTPGKFVHKNKCGEAKKKGLA